MPFKAVRFTLPSALFGRPVIFTVPDVFPSRSRSLPGRSMGSAASRLPAFTPLSVAVTVVLFGVPYGIFTAKSAEPPSGCSSFPLLRSIPMGETATSVDTLPSPRPWSRTLSTAAFPFKTGS